MKNADKYQIELCAANGVEICEANPLDTVGISQSALGGRLPLNGLRHASENGTTGWFIWGGEEFSHADNFFAPLHTYHLAERCALATKFLLLPAGWRFLTDGKYEDVWFDQALLEID